MKRISADERYYLIRRSLSERNKLYVSELAKQFQVTEKTIREDIKVLVQQGLVARFHGGITKVLHESEVPPLENELGNEYLNFKYGSHTNKDKKSEEVNSKVVIIGAFNVDVNVSVTCFPTIGETLLSNDTNYSIGGKAVNQSIAMVRNGSSVTLITKVGVDQLNNYVKSFFNSEENIYPILLETEESPTGHAIILIRDDGDKQIIVNPGANSRLLASEIRMLEAKVSQAEYLSLQLECSFESVKEAINIANSCGTKIILNPTPFNQNILDLLDGIFLLTINIYEAEKITGLKVTDYESAKEAMKVILNMGVKNIVLTMMDKGAICYENDQFSVIPGYKAVIMDKSGSGDAFNGALIAKISQGQRIAQAVDYACAYAALSIERRGASNMPQGSLTIIKLRQREKDHL
ncbi:putative Ribokinase [Vibrio nigripulchritudo SOn1]|uniref:Ribokinase n=1 Tax=Vibrio nigripulchritudo SOn1 TaxID=1238450 RepID=A0AAV2W005_9VIBR|nr:PfkB family carbohydrate kinase [Vibrio nigripulchritudo]CCO50199.1 putative Ribokinase [Vibrio nigripulchritudo SOn1]